MPVGKKIYDTMMKRFGARTKVVAKQIAQRQSSAPVVEKNVPFVLKSTNAPADIPERKISPLEGIVAINGKSGPDIVDKAIFKPKGAKMPDFGAAAINPTDLTKGKRPIKVGKKAKVKNERKCRLCKKSGHTARTCKMREG